MTYGWNEYSSIYKTVFGIKPTIYGVSALGGYRAMLKNIELNYNNSAEMAQKLNQLMTPYVADVKADPNKVLMPSK